MKPQLTRAQYITGARRAALFFGTPLTFGIAQLTAASRTRGLLQALLILNAAYNARSLYRRVTVVRKGITEQQAKQKAAGQ